MFSLPLIGVAVTGVGSLTLVWRGIKEADPFELTIGLCFGVICASFSVAARLHLSATSYLVEWGNKIF